jgi:hypothetical protein
MLVPQAAGSVRTYQLRPWQLRAAAVVGVVLLATALVGGIQLGAYGREQELAAMDVQLWNAQVSATALDDTLQAVRLASAIAAMTPPTGKTVAAGRLGGPAPLRGSCSRCWGGSAAASATRAGTRSSWCDARTSASTWAHRRAPASGPPPPAA